MDGSGRKAVRSSTRCIQGVSGVLKSESTKERQAGGREVGKAGECKPQEAKKLDVEDKKARSKKSGWKWEG